MESFYGIAVNDELIRVTNSFEKALKTNSVQPNSQIYQTQSKNLKAAARFFSSRYNLRITEDFDL